MIKNIIAYHHTSFENWKSISKNGFDRNKFKKICLGYGVQALLEETNYPIFENNLEGQIKVKFDNCNYLNYYDDEDKKIIMKSVDKIISTEPYEKQVEVAKYEAKRLIKAGFDAYTYKYGKKDMIVFLNLPKSIKWIPYKMPQ